MTVDQLIAAYVPQPSDVDMFNNFSLDMTASQVLVDDNGKLSMRPAMQVVSGQKESERQLWRVTKVSKDRAANLEKVERAARLERMAAAYANDPTFEVEVTDYVSFGTELAKAFHNHTGEVPTFLLDDDGTL